MSVDLNENSGPQPLETGDYFSLSSNVDEVVHQPVVSVEPAASSNVEPNSYDADVYASVGVVENMVQPAEDPVVVAPVPVASSPKNNLMRNILIAIAIVIIGYFVYKNMKNSPKVIVDGARTLYEVQYSDINALGFLNRN